jgi:NAD(P)-dependent dehydrogenase (short-subunit alcohol dehydrogenase family)
MPFGIDVVIIQPGFIRTEFGGVTVQAVRQHSGQSAYQELAEGLAKDTETMYADNSKASDPTVVAKAIRRAVESSRPKPRYPVG